MKVHKDLKELLLDYTLAVNSEMNDLTVPELIDKFLINNSLALGKPEPLAKNKDCVDNFFCTQFEFTESSCRKQCNECKEVGG